MNKIVFMLAILDWQNIHIEDGWCFFIFIGSILPHAVLEFALDTDTVQSVRQNIFILLKIIIDFLLILKTISKHNIICLNIYTYYLKGN